MLIRALIVVLVILNIGTGLWWLTQAPAAPSQAIAGVTSMGVATLELLPSPATPAATPTSSTIGTDVGAKVTPAPAPPATAPAPAPAPAPAGVSSTVETAVVPATVAVTGEAKEQCVSLGTYASRAQAQAALEKLGAQALRPRIREVVSNPGASYRVMLPAVGSREEAQATVKRIVQAGISDYYIITTGEDANAIALGQYRNREGADRRLAQLTAAGFPAVLMPSGGEVAAVFWVDAALPAAVRGANLAATAGAARQQSLDCSGLR
jgi:hypothetical protein